MNESLANSTLFSHSSQTHMTPLWLTLRDGCPVYTATWKPARSTTHRATILFLHSLADHIERYDDLFKLLTQHGFKVHAFDQRGFGRTGRRFDDGALLGHSEGFARALGDVEEAVRRCAKEDEMDEEEGFNNGSEKVTAAAATAAAEVNRARRKKKPLFLWGQGYGGAMALNYAVIGRGRRNVSGVIATDVTYPEDGVCVPMLLKAVRLEALQKGDVVCAPMLVPTRVIAPREMTILLTSIAANLLPSYAIHTGIEARHFGNDSSLQRSYSQDLYVHDLVSIQTLTDIIYNGRALLKWRSKEIDLPLYVSHGTDDLLSDLNGTKTFMERLKRGLDQIHNDSEPVRTDAVQDIIAWIDGRI